MGHVIRANYELIQNVDYFGHELKKGTVLIMAKTDKRLPVGSFSTKQDLFFPYKENCENFDIKQSEGVGLHVDILHGIPESIVENNSEYFKFLGSCESYWPDVDGIELGQSKKHIVKFNDGEVWEKENKDDPWIKFPYKSEQEIVSKK